MFRASVHVCIRAYVHVCNYPGQGACLALVARKGALAAHGGNRRKEKGKERYTPSLGSDYALWLLVGLLLGEIVACGKCECEATYNKHQRRYTIACLCKWLYLFDNLGYLDRKGLVCIL